MNEKSEKIIELVLSIILVAGIILIGLHWV
jgi:hypothetical protein